jgi:hypothetical protein
MAIIQISKIQQRSGNLVDLPQLDEAQFGWASDAKRLFIGKTTPNENIEVLTSYSNISFSQIDGSGGANYNINTPVNGQILTYVASTNTWDNFPSPYITDPAYGGDANFKLNIGDASYTKLTGGATGYVLQTDGLGNLSWTPKTTIVANIQALSNTTPIVMTVANTTPYTNGSQITISGVNGNANGNVNSTIFFVKVANDFPSTGNVSLYLDSSLISNSNGTGLTYTNSPNALAISAVGGTSTLVAAGTNSSIQFNNGGTLQGSPYLTIQNGNGLLTHTGPYIAAGNVYANSGTIGAASLTGSLTTNAQPNITSTGTLSSLSVTGNTNAGNLNTAGLVSASQVSANSNGAGTNFKVGDDAFIGDINVTNTMVIKGQQDGTKGYIVFGSNDTTSTLGRNGSGPLTYIGAFSATGNINGGNVIGTLLTGTMTTAAQPNITSTGTLSSLSVSGTSLFGGYTQIPGSASRVGIKFTGAGTEFGLAMQPSSDGTNMVTFFNAANSAVGSITQTASNVTWNGLVTGANVTGTVANATYATSAGSATTAGTVTTAAQPNITSVGTLTSLSVSGNITSDNITGIIRPTSGSGTAGIIFPADPGGGSGDLATIKYYAITGESTVLELAVTNDSDDTIKLNASGGTTITNTLTTTSISTGANTTAGTITGNWSLSTGSKLQSTYADLAEYYEADALYEPGTVLAFGGEKEVTLAEDGTTRVAGVVTTNPAYVMNSMCSGNAVAIALQGRVPCKVRGTVRKGDMMVSAGSGFARPWNNPHMGTVIGKALENFDGVEGVIEVAVGRL